VDAADPPRSKISSRKGLCRRLIHSVSRYGETDEWTRISGATNLAFPARTARGALKAAGRASPSPITRLSAIQFNSIGAFLLGLPSALGRTLQAPDTYTTRAWTYSLYARDQWQATRKLTVSYGTR